VQVAVVLLGVGMSAHLVRACRRERRLTFDAQLAIAMLLTAWLDPVPNFVQPVWFLSSELVNVTSWGGHYPFQVNPVAGDLPWPVVLLVGVYAFGVLGIIMALNALTRAIGRRWPSLSRAKLVAITYAAIIVLHPLLEAPIIGLHIWALAGSPAGGRLGIGSTLSYSWFQAPMASFMVGTLAAVRLLRDDHSRTVVERGLDRHDPRRRTALSLLALVALCNLVWIMGCGYQAVMGLSSGHYPDAPRYLVNGLCDVGTTMGTKYGPCPGSEGYRIPLGR
jgi:Spirocyclase AveC-like